MRAATTWLRLAAGGLIIAGGAGGCTKANMPKLPLAPLGWESGPVASSGPHEISLMVSGTPTGVFAQVAHGALGCWFGADGPLKASHVYRAEAEPPAKGGDAEIVIHERDVSLRDQRGVRAYRISFAAEGWGVRLIATAIKFDLKLAQAMARDVEAWAKGARSCELRTVLPPPAPPVLAKAVKGSGQKRKR